jgi:citrate lyase subunit beta/citryl-CoA lyase
MPSAAASIRWPLRSLLYVPAHKLDWVKKVARHKPDAVILDLEDAVSPAQKVGARETAREGIAILSEAGIAPLVRINTLDAGGDEDVYAVAAKGLAGIVLPKVRDAKDVQDLDLVLSYAEGRTSLALRTVAIIPTPETASGLRNTYEIALASPRVVGLVGLVGGPIAGDFARAAGFHPTMEGSEQLYFASKTVLDSRAAGAAFPIAAVIGTKLDDLAAVRLLAERAKTIGFKGAMVIHPSHAAVINDVFSPSALEVEDAVDLLDAMERAEAAGDGAIAHRGRMVDYAMIDRAKEIQSLAERYGLPIPVPSERR